MPLTLRVDLDYVPWDSPDAGEFGHGEPAVLLRLLDLGRGTGFKFHFFVSNRALRAFPANAEVIVSDGHDLDWLCKHPESPAERLVEMQELFGGHGLAARGFAIRGPWPEGVPAMDFPFTFLSASAAPSWLPWRVFRVETKTDRDAARSGQSALNWTDGIKAALRDAATRGLELTVCVRPQVLAKFDPKLGHVREILDLAGAVGMPVQTYRELSR